MGNCQAVDAAAVVMYHPDGRRERMYWPVLVGEVMKMNPGHYVSLVIQVDENESDGVKFSRVKLLRPTDTLLLGHAYRLVTSEEVVRMIKAKKCAKLMMMKKKNQEASGENQMQTQYEQKKKNQALKPERNEQRCGSSSTNLDSRRSRSWRPSLQSISES